MPPGLGTKGKGKAKDGGGRHSRSRNTTPSSAVNVPVSAGSSNTAYLDISIGAIMVPSNIMYDEILERHGGSGGIPDLKHLEALKTDLNTLSQLAASREKACDGGMRELSSRRKQRLEEDVENEQANREAESKLTLKRSAEDDEIDRANKIKPKKRKDHNKPREERPLAHGAHGVARQDGVDASPKAKPTGSPGIKGSTASGSSSPLSPPSPAHSPSALDKPEEDANRNSPARSSSSEESHQPPPAASIPQYQTFGSNPLEFDDPTIYHVREITDDMTDDEKKDIYCVSVFPHDDLRDLVAGIPPDKDFSNAKPTNQVNANTFATYIEPFFRQLTDEDMAFLKERGDRVTPFLMPRRGTKHYAQIWAEEDGSVASDLNNSKNRLAHNQPRGSIDQMDDEVAETDQISAGPLLSRLLSTMRVEHRPEEKEKANGVVNGDSSSNALTNGDLNGDHFGDLISDDPQPPATSFPESGNTSWKNVNLAKSDYAQADERLKAELRFIGFIGQEDEPEYDSHFDDEVAQRLRLLQTELKKQMILNGARKARLHQIAEEHMGWQEFAHIKDDLDNQVVQAFSKRNRTLGKGKKNAKRPGGAGGGSHPTGGAGTAAGVSRPGIGDAARTIMDRRKRWNDTISPIFSEDVVKVRGPEDLIFKDEDMAPFLIAEKDRLEEEAE